jgi:hypothetical protein
MYYNDIMEHIPRINNSFAQAVDQAELERKLDLAQRRLSGECSFCGGDSTCIQQHEKWCVLYEPEII